MEPITIRQVLEQALPLALEKLEAKVPLTKNEFRTVDLSDVKPKNLQQFIQDAGLEGEDLQFTISHEEDGFSWQGTHTLALCYWTTVDTTEDERLAFRRKRFDDALWAQMYRLLWDAGYTRVGSGLGVFEKFEGKPLYDWYSEGRIDILEMRYGWSFGLNP